MTFLCWLVNINSGAIYLDHARFVMKLKFVINLKNIIDVFFFKSTAVLSPITIKVGICLNLVKKISWLYIKIVLQKDIVKNSVTSFPAHLIYFTEISADFTRKDCSWINFLSPVFSNKAIRLLVLNSMRLYYFWPSLYIHIKQISYLH